jgi:ABC transporter substrate binding protein
MGLAGHRRGTEVDPLIAEDRAILARGRRGDRIKRREFIALIGGAAAWPLAAGAQQAMPVDSSSADEYAPFLAAFRAGLGEAGFVQGHNVAVEYRWAEGHYDRLPALALELVRHPVAVLVATGITAARAARAETSTIPIVFNTGGDPVRFGLVASLNRPGGNVTGVASLGKVLVAKRFELLRELVPKADTIAYLVNPNNAVADLDSNDAQSAAAALGQKLIIVKAGDESVPVIGFLDSSMATRFAKVYREEKSQSKESGLEAPRALPGVHHPIFKGKPVNYDPRERFIAEFMAERGDYNAFHAFYRELVQALYDTGATRYVFCVNVDAVIAALLLAVLWKDYRSGALSEKDLETAAFNVFLYGRMIGAAAEIDDHLNRGRNMDTRTPQEQCAFVV